MDLLSKDEMAEHQHHPIYSQAVSNTYIKPQARRPHDPNVTFEEYHHYALRTREEEETLEAPKTNWKHLMLRKRHHDNTGNNNDSALQPSTEKKISQPGSNHLDISDEEWTNASRAFRTAGWGACFYLITTDIIGPYGVGFAIGTLGWGPGIALFTVFGFLAGYSGYLVWHVFLGIDSYEFPARNYGDLAFRTWGTPARHLTNVMQALGLLLILGQVTIQFGENISQVSKFKLCYAVCPVIFVCAGFFLSQIRTLKAYGWVASLAVWLNLLVIFITMGVIAHSPPNFAISKLGSAGSSVDPTTITPDANGNYPSIIHYAGLPPNSLVGSINGLMQGVLAYSGVQLFVEFMAEMRRPRDFIQAMWGAQFFIYTVYLVYGSFVYHYQGQYTFAPSYQGVSPYAWQTVGNMISLLAGLIAAGLYVNIGIKVVYNNVLIDIFHAPPLTTTRGKILYASITPIWWSIAFVIAASIPDYFGFVGIMASALLLNLTYTLPPFFALAYDIQRDSIQGVGFDPATGQTLKSETVVKRWIRGFFGGGTFHVARNTWHLVYFLGSLSLCGLGMYSSIIAMKDAFKTDQLNSFSCRSPLNLNA